MSSTRWQRLSRAFDELCDLAPESREVRLEALAREDADLARELRAMLAADSTGRGALAAGPLALGPSEAQDDAPDAEISPGDALAAGLRFGPWRLVERLGAGGMGEVWAAERAEGDFEQRVAVKVLKRGMDSAEIVRRFVRERRILARLEHTGIARLFDGGTTPDGRPYFVLERVDGLPLTEHARTRSLALADRLRLVIAACEAVAFAHRQLVVHRDLKPSNILVTPRGELKLLDFGIAKLLEAEDDATVTRTEARALTPAYAAPEQIRGDPPTTATDVYGLGVVLYELLTGRLPHPRRRRAAVDLAHEVATEGVERPSRAVLREPEGAGVGIASERLARTLRDDLDTIALKALAREPERRYPTAAALADDLRRFLAGRPIAARPDTVAYRLRKFARRHRAAVAAAGLAVVSLVGGLAVALWQADRARAAQASAETEARRAGRVKEFLVSLFQASNPELVRSLDVSAREVLAEGVQRLEVELDREPGVQAEILEAVARGELSLGQTETAKRHALRALALLDSDVAVGSAAATVRSRLEATLAAVEAANGDLPAAERRLRSALADLESSGRATAVDRAAIRLELGRTLAAGFKHEEAIAQFREAYELSTSAGEVGALSALAALGDLANRLTFLDRREEAERAFRDALASSEQLLRDRPLLRARLQRAFALFLFQEDKLEAALQHARSAVATHLAILGERHVETAASQRVLAIGLLAKGETEGAVGLLEQAAATFAELSPLHPLHEQVVETLAAVEFHAGRADQAIARVTALAVEVERRAGSEAIQTLRAKMTLASILNRTGHDQEAMRIYTAVLPIARSRPQAFDAATYANLHSAMGDLLARQGRVADAIELLREGVGAASAHFGPQSRPAAVTVVSLAGLLASRGRAEDRAESRRLLEPLAEIPRIELGHGRHPLELLAELDLAEGRATEADAKLERLIARLTAEGGGTMGTVARAKRTLARIKVQLGQFVEARALLEEVLAGRRAFYGAEDPRTHEIEAELAGLPSG